MRRLSDPDLLVELERRVEQLADVLDGAARSDRDAMVPWTGRTMKVAWFGEHMREELVLHRWDVVGDDAELAERYGWINRALPADALNDFVRSLALRISGFPDSGLGAVKDRVNAITLAPAEDFRHDSDLFGEGVRNPEAQKRIQAALKRGFQTRHAEIDLARMLGELDEY